MKKLSLLILLCSIKLASYGQTVVISPTGDGGFETGTTFPLNGWTVVNAAANQWAVGTGSIYAGTRGAYIGNTTTFAGTNAFAISHFYRDITLPAAATNVQLTFQYKQPVVDNMFDSFYVATTATTNTPAAYAPLGFGYTRLYNNTGTAYAAYTTIGPISLTALAGTTFRLVFSYRNDGSNPTGVPAIDNISLSYCLTPAAFTVTGGGIYCSGGPSPSIGLSGSVTGISYQLYNGAAAVGSSVAGTGGALAFGTFSAAGTYTVLATNTSGGGCTAAMSGSAIVTNPAPVTPSVSLTTGLSGTVCSGSMATFTATPVNGGSTPSYQWTVNGMPVGGSGSTYSYIPADGDIINVVLTAAGGICPAPATASSSFTASITSYMMPSVTTTVTPGTHVCTGTPVNFTATPLSGGSAPAYKWIKNGVYVATGPSYYSAMNNGDIMKVLLFSNYPCRLADSVYSAESIMNVETPTPAPTVSIFSSSGFLITAGQNDSFVAVAAGGTASLNYQWYVNSVQIAGATTPVYTTNALTNGSIVSCKVWNTDFCGASTVKSVVVSVGAVGVGMIDNQAEFSIVPNPNNGAFTLAGSGDDITATITDMVGRIVYTEAVNAIDHKIEHQVGLSNLPAGVYMLTLNSEGVHKVLRFVVDK